ncbi:AGAP013321-PA [Anopheles gambiae str. PEST]|uniref:AGAP013321-PA n=1 Tax=Anopheles gambiae TaxID=7165 RepID=F5HKR1_ANOGA|nr:AGAP013321-PA [Anopheles gambiae str. PEST]
MNLEGGDGAGKTILQGKTKKSPSSRVLIRSAAQRCVCSKCLQPLYERVFVPYAHPSLSRCTRTGWESLTFVCMFPVANGAIPETACGRAGQLLGNCFRNFTPTVAVEALHAVKIPDSLEEINSRCLIFNRGMECVRQYLRECVNARQRKIIENEVYGAQKLYEYLCYDQAFQREFLRHKSCFQLVHPEWDLCSNQFIGVLKEEMARVTKQSINVQYVNFCW